MSGACSKHEENREKEKVSMEESGEKEDILDLDLGAYVCTMYKHVQRTRVSSFIVAPCILESLYCSLTNKCTFY